jgi:DNA-binding NarL/FixJ family response regulator
MNRPRLLLADDEPAMRQLLRGFLSEDYDVVETAPDGQTLVAAALQLAPDIIITDIDMPGMDGIQAVRQLRGLIPRAKVLFLPSHADLEHIAAAFAAGAAGYLIKGDAPDLLYNLSRTIEGLHSQPEHGAGTHGTGLA